MPSWNTAGQMPQPEAPEGQQPGQMPGAMPQRQEPEEEENKTISHGYDKIDDGTHENESRSTTLHEYVIDAQDQPSLDKDQDETMSENSMCQMNNAREIL